MRLIEGKVNIGKNRSIECRQEIGSQCYRSARKSLTLLACDDIFTSADELSDSRGRMADTSTPDPQIKPQATSETNVSGGVNLDTQRDVNIRGDVVGRDKITSGDTIAGDKTEVRAEPGSKVIHHEETTQIIPAWLGIGAIIAIVVVLAVTWVLSHPTRVRMSGDFKVAVAGFAIDGQSSGSTNDVGTELAQNVFKNLDSVFQDLRQGFQITTWGPDKVGTIEGVTAEERAKSARARAEEIGADVVVYGVVDVSSPVWKVVPEFYLSEESITNVHEVADITGDHEMGRPITLTSQNDLRGRLEISGGLRTRVQALAKIVIGIALYYRNHDYQKALEIYQAAESLEEWKDDEGKNVLYLLMGNAVVRKATVPTKEPDQNSTVPTKEPGQNAAVLNKELDQADLYFQKSLAIDPNYARSYVNLGAVDYLRALTEFNTSEKPEDIDQRLLSRSIENFEHALQVTNRPATADIETKVHFGLGQAYFMQTYSGKMPTFNAAVAEFQKVIAAFADGINPRVKELAAESHARLGAVYDLSGYTPEAIAEYETAASLSDDPARHDQFSQRAQALKQALLTPAP